MAGLGTFGGMSMLSAANPTMFGSMFGKAAGSSALSGGTGAASNIINAGAGLGTATPAATSSVMSAVAPATSAARDLAIANFGKAGAVGGAGITGNAGTNLAMHAAAPAMTAPTAAAPGLLDQAGDFIGNMSTAEKIGLGVGGANLLSGMMAPEPPPLKDQMPYSEEDYSAAYAREQDRLQGIGDRYAYDLAPQQDRGDIYSPINPIYANEGGLISVAKFNEGGVNYLPSKLDHDENDSNNYVRAQGYVEDSTGIGDKDEDTMLAQLADGEFVSRADAVLGAGILSGANAKSFKEMRAKGASFFYKQQKQFKRIYDIVNATDKKS
jgi:hypothetical protein